MDADSVVTHEFVVHTVSRANIMDVGGPAHLVPRAMVANSSSSSSRPQEVHPLPAGQARRLPGQCLIRYYQDKVNSTTGRIAAHFALFRELGGYDEDLLGTGFQDIDLVERFGRAYGRNQAIYTDWVGDALQNVTPEQLGQRKAPSNLEHCNAKIAQMDPAVLAQFKHAKNIWQAIDVHNRKVGKAKKSNVRNEGRSIGVEFEQMVIDTWVRELPVFRKWMRTIYPLP